MSGCIISERMEYWLTVRRVATLVLLLLAAVEIFDCTAIAWPECVFSSHVTHDSDDSCSGDGCLCCCAHIVVVQVIRTLPRTEWQQKQSWSATSIHMTSHRTGSNTRPGPNLPYIPVDSVLKEICMERIRVARLLLAALFAPLEMSAHAPQATIRAEIKTGGRPVQGAEVAVSGQRTRTAPDGVVILPAALGHVEINVTKEGFFPAHAALDIDAVREWTIQIELVHQGEQQENVTVYATRNDVRVQDSPVRVEVVSLDEINEEIAMRPGDVSMLLNEMGGMRVQTTSPALGAASVRVQGMLGRYTAFLSDGLPLFGSKAQGLGLLQIPPMDLGQLEVIEGNASALYGSAAMAGVVDLISRRPSKEPLYDILFNRSSLGGRDAAMFLASQLNDHWGASLLGGASFRSTATGSRRLGGCGGIFARGVPASLLLG